MALVEKAFGDIITFTRASGGGRINSLGQYEWVAANVPRLTHDPVTLQPLGLLVEEQRTNLLLRSTLGGGTSGAVGAGAVAPTGWAFAAPTPGGEITFGTTSLGTAGIRFQATAQRPGLTSTITALANTVYSNHARITVLGSGSLEIQNAVWAPGAPAGATLSYWRNGTIVEGSTAVAAGDHVAVIVAVGATSGTFQARFGAGVQANATCDITMTMPQVEAGLPSSYIPTTTAQVTRAADVCSVNTLSPWYNASEGTLVVNASSSVTAAISRYITLPGFARLRVNSSAFAFQGIAGASVDINVVTNVPAPNSASHKIAVSYRQNDCRLSVDGGQLITDSSATISAATSLVIGNNGSSGEFLNGIISSITYYPRVIDVQQASA